ncbi:xanthine dehydrogenase molybdopterin binding subunit [Corticibacter populi]|uniref:Xanthine dehydrogenase molybdopterin binding subunit n=1 Tax=Corticibacter populi TaxID=1550736 RepID=A0A3M6QME4_9BURK|nr:xanthine dehydrogenase molybdopterin binding subunit [Corticibacter populi]RMX04224.1 xanthine dehydrogenase molybdopterin binding subunit [Corticibacter populi]RZS33258.1 xanthine dehydrogenase molybdenum binding subunit apoprotein [Corticibacter populi]
MNQPQEALLPAPPEISPESAGMPDAATKPRVLYSRSEAHESAHLHVSGSATYVDDMPELAGTLHAAIGMSAKAHARILAIDFTEVQAMPGVVGVLQAGDIPGSNDCGPILHDDPILADGVVKFVGQPMFAVVATSQEAARRAARKARVEYEELPAVLDIRAAKAAGELVVPPLVLVRGSPEEKLASAPHVLRGTWSVGGQEQFYLEGQISYAVPREDGCMQLWCSTQHPTEMQHLVAHCLQLASNQVVVEIRRMGGGFGGKESQSGIFACIAALAARRFGRPVKLRPDRDDDMMITGKRHDFVYDYAVGFDDTGRILAAKVEMAARAGFSTDLTPPVITRAVCHFDNAYYLGDADIRAFGCRTHTQSNTAFRGFGGPQGAIMMEYIIDSIARQLGMDALAVRRINFYGTTERNVTPYLQVVRDNIIGEMVDELVATSDYHARRAAIARFNAGSPVLKKGLALTPVKFGISFNVPHFNQAGALVHVYTDGSVLVSHGGTEMGQGLNTKVAQVVAHTLGVPLAQVRASAADTSKVANTSATAASTGSDLNGKAAEDAARQIRARLAAFAAPLLGGAAEDAARVRFADGAVALHGAQGACSLPFADVVAQAYLARVQLWSDGFYATPGLHWDARTLTGNPFYYYAYAAGVSEVLVDTLTGEWRLLRTDLLYDAGNSINPAIDIGQVEGGFIQGMGWLTSEELVWNREGRLTTHAPSTYKIPAIHDCPAEFRTRLFQRPNPQETVLRSKATGEPPLLLPFSVLMALRDAVSSVGGHRVQPPLRAPATPEAILDAVDAVRAGVTEAPGVTLHYERLA